MELFKVFEIEGLVGLGCWLGFLGFSALLSVLYLRFLVLVDVDIASCFQIHFLVNSRIWILGTETKVVGVVVSWASIAQALQ